MNSYMVSNFLYLNLINVRVLSDFSKLEFLSLLTASYLAGVLGGARAPPEFGGSEKGRSLISAYRSLAITTGQLILKRHFGFIQFFQKTNEEFLPQ